MKLNLSASKIKEIFGFKKQYCDFLIEIIRGLCACETVRLSVVSLYLGYQKQKSGYQRLRRFLASVVFCQKALARLMIEMSGLNHHDKWIVVLDRTYWMFGKTHLTFLYMSVCVGEITIPLFFNLLGPDKKGNSSFEERKTILELFLETFGKERILYVLGDREFVGFPWINFLLQNEIPFSQRIRESGQKISNARGEMILAKNLFEDLKVGETRTLENRKIGRSLKHDLRLDVAGTRSIQGDLVIVVHQKTEDPLEAYRQRWCIEICFRTLKFNGFGIEDSHVRKPERITCLLSIASLAYAITIQIGNAIESKKKTYRKKKNHGYKEKSIVRFTLDLIKPFILHALTLKSSSRKPSKYLFPPDICKLVG